MISFKTDKASVGFVSKIVERASRHLNSIDKAELSMDILACHCNGCELDLAKLLKAPDRDFFHDLFGIQRHIDRTTGRLGDCFLPRCSA